MFGWTNFSYFKGLRVELGWSYSRILVVIDKVRVIGKGMLYSNECPHNYGKTSVFVYVSSFACVVIREREESKQSGASFFSTAVLTLA